MKNSYKIIILVVVLVAAVFLEHSLVNLSETDRPPANETSEELSQEIEVNLRIDFDNGNIKNYASLDVISSSALNYDNIKLEEGKTVFDLLKKVTEENNLEFSYEEYSDMGALIESVDNVKNDVGKNSWWQYWVNGEYATVAADKYELKNNDLVEWKYIKGQF